MKTLKISRLVLKIALSAMMLMTAYNFLFDTQQVEALFTSLGQPSAIIIPLAIAKILGVLAIMVNRVPLLKNLAYVGFLVDFSMAAFAHFQAGDDMLIMPLIALALLVAIVALEKKIGWNYEYQ